MNTKKVVENILKQSNLKFYNGSTYTWNELRKIRTKEIVDYVRKTYAPEYAERYLIHLQRNGLID